jgi:hypothetical protein
MIDASGMGLLPGIALAFGLSLIVMLGLLLETWWAIITVLIALFAIAGAVTYVVVKLVGADGGGEH